MHRIRKWYVVIGVLGFGGLAGCALDSGSGAPGSSTEGVRDLAPVGIAAAYGGREVPVERIALSGQVSLREALGPAEGEVFVGDLEDEGEVLPYVFTEFVGPAQDDGFVQLAANFPLEALQRARAGETVEWSGDVPPIVLNSVDSGLNQWEPMEAARLELEVSEGSAPGMERLEIRAWGDMLSSPAVDQADLEEGAEPMVMSSVLFEYDPAQLLGEEAPAESAD